MWARPGGSPYLLPLQNQIKLKSTFLIVELSSARYFAGLGIIIVLSSFAAEQAKWQAYATSTIFFAVSGKSSHVPCSDDDAGESNGNDDEHPEVLGHNGLPSLGIP